MPQMREEVIMDYHSRKLLDAREAAAIAGVSLAAFWRGVSSHRFPNPVYPAPRAPRWYYGEIQMALEATRASPRAAMAARREGKLEARVAAVAESQQS